MVDRENPDIITWVRKRGDFKKIERDIQLEQSHQHFNLIQNPRSGHAILQECDLCKRKIEKETNEISPIQITPATCNLVRKTNILIWYCDLLNQIQSWRKKTILEIPVDCIYLEEEIKRQVKENSQFIGNQPTDSFLDVEIKDLGITIIQDNIESEEHKKSLIQEYRLNHQQYQILDFQFYTDESLGNSID